VVVVVVVEIALLLLELLDDSTLLETSILDELELELSLLDVVDASLLLELEEDKELSASSAKTEFERTNKTKTRQTKLNPFFLHVFIEMLCQTN
jgi:hypothetical protein